MKYILVLFSLVFSLAHLSVVAQPYKVVIHNVENLFDADGVAVFDTYEPFDSDGNPQYTPMHVYTKVLNTARLLSLYNDGDGPDIIMFVELESDYTPLPGGELWDYHSVLEEYKDVTLKEMLGEKFDDRIKDMPSELLLLKGFEDFGLTGYDVDVAYDRDENLRPNHVQKNVVFSRLPIQHEKSKAHPILDARPIQEVWINVDGYDLVLFNNHWKSRASDAEIEKIRLQNAEVLKNRLDELRSENPHIDFILGGDFNSDYNQSHRYEYMDKTAVNDVLRSVGDERKVKDGDTDAVYNLWYEHPIDQRGSDVFRGNWGTLMQIMISPGLYNYHGIQYVDNSFDVLRIPGKNVHSNSGAPNRWHDFEQGGGYSDHLPISMKFTVVDQDDPEQKITLENPGYNDDDEWEVIEVAYTMPEAEYIFMPDEYGSESVRKSKYFGELMLITSTLGRNNLVEVNGETYGLYSPTFNTRNEFSDLAGSGEEFTFIGRLGTFRGNWQFVIEDISYVNPEL